MKKKTNRNALKSVFENDPLPKPYVRRGDAGPRPTKPNVPEVMRVEVSRPVAAGVKHRGDRRDTSKAYTGNTRHPSRGNTARIDVKTRAR